MMKCFTLILLVSLTFIKNSAAAAATAAGNWCYEIQGCAGTGPRLWRDNFPLCGGQQQSPINIHTKTAVFKESLKLNQFNLTGYGDIVRKLNITNNGHSAQVNLPSGIEISGGGLSGTYVATQFHFHWGSDEFHGSEHSIDGEKFPMELHIVHQRKIAKADTSGSGDLAVLGFFYEETSKNNTEYDSLIKSIEAITAVAGIKNFSANLAKLIPQNEALGVYYRYNGSLTTPPCTETVTWTLFNTTIKLSKQQLQAFHSNLNFTAVDRMVENFRPVQKRGNRIVYTSSSQVILSSFQSLFICFIISFITIMS